LFFFSIPLSGGNRRGLLGQAAKRPPTRRERDATHSIDDVGSLVRVRLNGRGGATSQNEEGASQPGGGETDPRTPVANADALQCGQTAVRKKREAPRSAMVTARLALARKRPNEFDPTTGTCIVIG